YFPQNVTVERKLYDVGIRRLVGVFGGGTIGLIVENHHALVMDSEPIDNATHLPSIDIANDRLLSPRIGPEQRGEARIIDNVEGFLREESRVGVTDPLACEPRLRRVNAAFRRHIGQALKQRVDHQAASETLLPLPARRKQNWIDMSDPRRDREGDGNRTRRWLLRPVWQCVQRGLG